MSWAVSQGTSPLAANSFDDTMLSMPVPKPRKAGTDPHQPKRTDSSAVGAWRVRMATSEAKAIYKQRAATVETVNGELKTVRGLGRFLVRGLHKAWCVALWSVLAYNIMHLGAQMVRLTS
jgi:hypothetical protein